MVSGAPTAILQRPPSQQVPLAGTGGKGGEQVAAIAANADIFVICLPYRQRTVVDLQHTGPAIVIAKAEGPPQKMLLQGALAEGKILQVDVQFRVAIHVVDTLVGPPSHRRQVPRA